MEAWQLPPYTQRLFYLSEGKTGRMRREEMW